MHGCSLSSFCLWENLLCIRLHIDHTSWMMINFDQLHVPSRHQKCSRVCVCVHWYFIRSFSLFAYDACGACICFSNLKLIKPISRSHAQACATTTTTQTHIYTSINWKRIYAWVKKMGTWRLNKMEIKIQCAYNAHTRTQPYITQNEKEDSDEKPEWETN